MLIEKARGQGTDEIRDSQVTSSRICPNGDTVWLSSTTANVRRNFSRVPLCNSLLPFADGYACEGSLLRLSLLRAPTVPDADADQGHHAFSFAGEILYLPHCRPLTDLFDCQCSLTEVRLRRAMFPSQAGSSTVPNTSAAFLVHRSALL